MKYLTVKVSIAGISNGANADYGTRVREIEMSSKYDEEKLFAEIDSTITRALENENPNH